MNLEELKAALEDLNADSHHEPANLDMIRDSAMRSRDTFKWRDLREIAACMFVFAAFGSFLLFELPGMARLGCVACCLAAIYVGTSIVRGRRRHRVFPELSVVEFLDAEIAHLDYQIHLLRNVSWWYLAPLAVGFLIVSWGLLPAPQALAASAGYFLLDRTINWLNQFTARHQLQPQKEKLERVRTSLNELIDTPPTTIKPRTPSMRNQIGYTIYFAAIIVACWAIRMELNNNTLVANPGTSPVPVSEPETAAPSTASSVADLAEPLIRSGEADGLSIGIVAPDAAGKLQAETSHFGMASPDAAPVDGTIYEIGGLTNAFTGILLASAVTKGELMLDTPAQDLAPQGVRIPHVGDRPVTLLNMVTHRSGLPRIASNMPVTRPNDPYYDYTSQLAGEFLNSYQPMNAPDSQDEYSNFAMAYLGYLLTRHADAGSYDEILQDRITDPLQMSSTTVQLADSTGVVAIGHTAAGDIASPWHSADMPGAGGIHSCIADMNRFMLAQLKPPGNDIGKAIDLAFRKHVDAIGRGNTRGLGWIVAGDGSTRWHNGMTGGFAAAMFVNRDLNIGVCVLCNTASDKVTELAGQLLRYRAGVQQSIPQQSDPNAMMDRFVGRYQLAPTFIFDVKRRGNKLMVGITNQATQQVYQTSEFEWAYRGIEASLLFGEIKAGKARSVTLLQNGLRQKAQRIKERDGEGYPRLSPFSAIRWRGFVPQVKVEGEWHELVSINDLGDEEIVSFSRATYGRKWKMRFEEDLVELLSKMGHPPQNAVKLILKSLENDTMQTLESVRMTEENRNAIKRAAGTR